MRYLVGGGNAGCSRLARRVHSAAGMNRYCWCDCIGVYPVDPSIAPIDALRLNVSLAGGLRKVAADYPVANARDNNGIGCSSRPFAA